MKRLKGRFFSLVVCGIFAGAVFWAFARNFYLAEFLGSSTLSAWLRFHGVVMSGWVVLLLAESALIAAHRVRWHRWLGTFGVFWAGLVVIVGTATTLRASAREVHAPTAFTPVQLTITGLELTEMLLFALLVAGAVWWRRQGGIHKRLMLLTIITMLGSIFPRLPVELFQSTTAILVGVDASLLLLVALDALWQQRLHPAFAWGGSLIVVTLHAVFLGARTAVWRDFLSGLLS